ncbi:MAG: TspO/MBR family protein [Candidatus Gastranaerophilales bacterium]
MNIDYNFLNELVKPVFQPPAWVFSPVWLTLYTLMAVSFIIILAEKSNKLKPLAISVFIIQLLLNLSWTPIFFGYYNIKLALLICVSLTLLVAFMIYIFYKISRISAFLLLPYLIWLIFASVLNLAFVILNPSI